MESTAVTKRADKLGLSRRRRGVPAHGALCRLFRGRFVSGGPDKLAELPHGDFRGGQIERPSGVGAPVHQQLLVVIGIVVNTDPPDVETISFVEIQPAEAQPVLGRVELGNLLEVHGAKCLALGPRLVRAAALLQHLCQPVRGALPHVVKPTVEHGDVPLLSPDVIP